MWRARARAGRGITRDISRRFETVRQFDSLRGPPTSVTPRSSHASRNDDHGARGLEHLAHCCLNSHRYSSASLNASS